MFGLIKDLVNLPQKLAEDLDDAVTGGYVTGDRRSKESGCGSWPHCECGDGGILPKIKCHKLEGQS